MYNHNNRRNKYNNGGIMKLTLLREDIDRFRTYIKRQFNHLEVEYLGDPDKYKDTDYMFLRNMLQKIEKAYVDEEKLQKDIKEKSLKKK